MLRQCRALGSCQALLAQLRSHQSPSTTRKAHSARRPQVPLALNASMHRLAGRGPTDAGAPPRGGGGTPSTPLLSRASAETMMRLSCSQVSARLVPELLCGVLRLVLELTGQSRLTKLVCTAGQAGSRRAGAARSGSHGAWTPARPSSGSRVGAAQLARALLPCWPCQARHARSRAQDAHPVQRRRHAAQAAGARRAHRPRPARVHGPSRAAGECSSRATCAGAPPRADPCTARRSAPSTCGLRGCAAKRGHCYAGFVLSSSHCWSARFRLYGSLLTRHKSRASRPPT